MMAFQAGPLRHDAVEQAVLPFEPHGFAAFWAPLLGVVRVLLARSELEAGEGRRRDLGSATWTCAVERDRNRCVLFNFREHGFSVEDHCRVTFWAIHLRIHLHIVQKDSDSIVVADSGVDDVPEIRVLRGPLVYRFGFKKPPKSLQAIVRFYGQLDLLMPQSVVFLGVPSNLHKALIEPSVTLYRVKWFGTSWLDLALQGMREHLWSVHCEVSA